MKTNDRTMGTAAGESLIRHATITATRVLLPGESPSRWLTSELDYRTDAGEAVIVQMDDAPLERVRNIADAVASRNGWCWLIGKNGSDRRTWWGVILDAVLKDIAGRNDVNVWNLDPRYGLPDASEHVGWYVRRTWRTAMQFHGLAIVAAGDIVTSWSEYVGRRALTYRHPPICMSCKLPVSGRDPRQGRCRGHELVTTAPSASSVL